MIVHEMRIVKIRLQGLPEDIEKAIEGLKNCFQLLSVSDYYANRNSEYVRCYVEVKGK